ncbi:hypothetical protein SAMN05660226_02271 [Parapedobacter luteus]|uniref:Uncharacterized protein n=1 Tax=Parapedobacter luteus TaxID=623280 RepID=A0A1T5CKB1_9SPHI|nr:hypothetical protein [Parapedobacter luteus]SKB59580.1 hypothetical protein SAMN05660226_02271 [Parapedobacter luteus]
MIILKTITGLLIAAVLYVPGTTQHEVAKVGEEPVVKENPTEIEQTMFWYNVNAAGTHTVGSPAFTGTKSEVIAAQGCKDLAGNICLYGSADDDLPDNTEIESPSPSEVIRRNNL